MRLVLHCGCHKTGTTSFQSFCETNREELKRSGILYPRLGDQPQHSGLLWHLQAGDSEALQKFFRSCRSELDADCGTVLLSGEDFENAVVDLTLASDIEADAQAAGFSEIVWVFVTRDKHDYAASIYAEMSKHNIVLQQGVVEEAMEKRGCLYVSTYNYNYIFALDFQRFTDRFMETLSGELWEFSMKDFLAISPGAALLRVLMGQYQYDRFVEVAQFYDNVENKRLKSDMVETEYLATALGLTQERRNKLRWRLILSIARSLKVRR